MYRLYVIEFPNRKRYFGITSRSEGDRWRDHKKVARRERGRPICKALNKYPDATIRTLVVGSKEYIEDLEARAISAFNTTDRAFGYNFGAGGDFNPMAGHPHYQPDIQSSVCHYFINGGQIQFLGDCTHALAGKTVDMPDIPEGRYLSCEKL